MLMSRFSNGSHLETELGKYKHEVIARTIEQKTDGILRVISGFTKSIGDKSSRSIRAVLSSETVDRYGDVILARAFNTPKNHLEYFKANPVMLWAHGRDSNIGDKAIGTIQNPTFDTKDINGNNAFEGDAVFAKDDADAEAIYNLYVQDPPVLKAFSVGFRPVTIKDPSEIPGCTGYEFQEVALLENSAVPIPANPAALRKAFALGAATEEFIVRSFFPLRDHIAVHRDIFMPTNWEYKKAFNEIETIHQEWKAGTFAKALAPHDGSKLTEIPFTPAPESSTTKVAKLSDYYCEFCQKDSKVNLASFAKAKFMDIEFNNVSCEHCKATTEQCLEMTSLLLKKSK